MADDQQFCLRWNNHQSTLISVFDTLLENGTLVDCTLAAEGQSLKAHKVVLSACSPYLETLLSEHYEKHPIIIMKDVKFTELKSMMDYMYRGEVNICQDQLGTFLKAAESLQIKGLSENGEGDARDVGSTTTRPPPPKRPPATPAARTDPEQPPAASPAHRPRDGSISPSSRKRRRTRRNSDDANHFDSNSCDLPLTPAQSTPVVPNIPASITSTPIRTPVVKPEINDRLDHNSLPPESGLLKEKIEPAEQLLEPKTEYLEDLNNDDSVEDLTLDDDDEMDMSQMSNMSNMSRPGPSHGTDISNQGFSPWQLGNQSGGNDEVFMAAQEAVNSHRDSQDSFELTYEPTTQEDSNSSENEALSKITCADIATEQVKSEFKCTGCAKTYPSRVALYRHRSRFCNREPRFFCDTCDYKTIQKHHLVRHMKQAHNKTSVENAKTPPTRNNDTEEKHHLVRHMKQAHNKTVENAKTPPARNNDTVEIFTCPNCEKLCVGSKCLQRHMQQKHNVKLVRENNKWIAESEKAHSCEHCDKRFTTKRNLKNHAKACKAKPENSKEELESTQKVCLDTTSEADRTTEQTDEERKNQTTNDQKYICTVCDKVYESKSKLLRHVNRTSCVKKDKRESVSSLPSQVGELFECAFCNFTAAFQSTLAKHTIKKHPESIQSETLNSFVVE